MNEAMPEAGRSVSFVIRLWEEPAPGKPEWRGHVRHVQGEAEAYFRDFSGLVEFLRQHAGVEVPLSVKQ